MVPSNNIDPGDTGPLNLIFANQFKCLPLIKRAPNNNTDPGDLGPLNLIFANYFKHITRVKISFYFKSC